MERELFRKRRHLRNDAPKKRGIHQLFFTHHFRAKAALEIANIADFDVHFLELGAVHWALHSTVLQMAL
jgi:hypothetical protein